MSLEKVLENWSEYENQKVRNGLDATNFNCIEPWEEEYLIKKIKDVYPYSEESIKWAIKLSCAELKSPHPRESFIKCVLHKLDL